MKKRLCACLLALLLTAGIVPAPARAASGVSATIPTYTWELAYENVDYKNSVYPPLNYKGVTYFPMTWGYCRLLGLTSVWIEGEGLFIASWGSYGPAAGDEFPTYAAANNPKTVTATLPTYPIYVNGKRIDNSKEEYPLLNFRGVTYFPMTWRFAREEFNWNTEWSAEENRFAIHWQIESDWGYQTSVYEVTDTAAYLVKYSSHSVAIGENERGDTVYTTENAQKYYTLDFATGQLTESEQRASYDDWAHSKVDMPIGVLPEGVTVRNERAYTRDDIPAPYTPFVAHATVTVDGREYAIGEGSGDVIVTRAVRVGDYVFCNAKRFTGWKGFTNPNEELYRIDVTAYMDAEGNTYRKSSAEAVERMDTWDIYRDYGSMKLIGVSIHNDTPRGYPLVVKCQQGSAQYAGEGGVMEASAYNDGYYAMNPVTGQLELLRRFVYTDGDILTPDGHIYGIFDWKNTVEKLY